MEASSASSQRNAEALRALYAEWARGNFRAGAELFAPDVVFDPLPDLREQRGLAAVTEYMRDFLAQWTDFQVEAEELIEVGEGFVVKERQRGQGKASGVRTESVFYAVWTFRAGRVSHVRWVADRDAALEAARGRAG
jgi:ketosteroid isomerase-like protein